MRTIFLLTTLVFGLSAYAGPCELSVANEYSSREEAHVFLKAVFRHKKILETKGFKTVTAYEGNDDIGIKEYELDIHYFDYDLEGKLVNLWLSDKNGILIDNLQRFTTVEATVKELLLALPSCDIVRRMSSRGEITTK